MSIRVIVNGAQGRMGQVTVKAVEAEPGLELVGRAGRGDDLAKMIHDTRADVVIDFTQPTSAYENTLAIIDAGARPIVGTTGLNAQQIKNLQDHCQKLKRGGVIAPNFSLGMVLLIKYAAEFAKYFPQVEIIEMHHDRKKDCPSGTALFTAEKLAAARGQAVKAAVEMHESVPGSRGAKHMDIPIHAVRLPGLVAHEQIIFGDIGETLTLRHDSIDRQCFMRGVMMACKKVMELDKLVNGLDQIL